MSNTTENESLVAEIADRLQAGDVPLRGGEQADWSREARSLIAAANPDEPTETLEHLVRNRLAGVPLAYLTRYETFLGDQYAVEPGVVVPHPATELLGLLALQAVDLHAPAGAPLTLLDVGTGVGNVSIAVLKRRPAVQAHASDLSGASVRLAALNAQRILDDPSRMYLYQAYLTDDVVGPFEARPVRGVSVVVSNPPYLVEGDEVSDATKKSGVAHFSYSPDNDPSWFLRCLVAAPDGMLNDDCSVLMECADWYLPDHEMVMNQAGWEVEVFDREHYLSTFAADPDMQPMTPTSHRVMHAWRGARGGLGGFGVDG
jgi:HemK-like putative methylase